MQHESGKPSSPAWLWPGLVLAAFSLLYFPLIYYPGLLRMDDFGYLQGVIDTLTHGRPQTAAWLEPYTATLSSLSAAAYLLTGNFPLSTWGLQSVLVLFNVFLLFRLFRTRLDAPAAALFALVVATQPVYWHKCSEFAGNVSTVTLVLLALLAYLRGRWIWFFVAAFLAFANRQNSIALMALPAYHFLWRRKAADGSAPMHDPSRAGRWMLVACLGAIAAADMLLHRSMNRTVAQEFGIYAGMNPFLAAAIVRTQLFGLFAGLACLSVFGLLSGENPRKNLLANLKRPMVPIALTMVFWMLPYLWPMPLISFLTPLIGSLDHTFVLQKILILLIPVLLWVLDFRLIRFDAPFCLFAAYTLISGLRGYWYDFYMLDVALAALFYRFTRPDTNFGMGRWAKAAAILMLAGHIVWGYGYKVLSDKQMLATQIYERMEREGKIEVMDMTDATFGYLGWKLFDHYWRHEYMTYPANYLCYVRRDRVVMETEVPWRRAFKLGDAQVDVLEQGTASVGYLKLRYRVVNKHSDSNIPICEGDLLHLKMSDYRKEPVPLDAKEWSDLISAQRR